ncbi:unnamed protein product [Amoebophrya sp. A25]|nr:unnamed protein product [Amoebophrya sp. A25]|eukprot:GSA25T00007071001.1
MSATKTMLNVNEESGSSPPGLLFEDGGSKERPLLEKKQLLAGTPESGRKLNNSARDGLQASIRKASKEIIADELPRSSSALRVSIATFSVPILIRLASTNVLIFLQTAYLGHCGVLYLGASALGDIITNTAAVCLQSRVSRNFMTLAYGAGNYKEVGLWLYTALYCLYAVCVPVMIIFWSVNWVLTTWFGVDPSIAALGGYYQSRMSLALPATVLFLELSNYFAAQGRTEPGVTAPTAAILFEIFVGLQVIFGVPLGDNWGSFQIGGYGFFAVPVVWSCMMWICGLFVVFYYCCYLKWHRKCLGDVSMFDPRIPGMMSQYFRMYVPSQTAMASDILRMSLISGVVATLGTTEVAVFKTTTIIALLAASCTYGLATGVTRYLAVALGAKSKADAQHVFRQGFILEFAFVFLKGLVIYLSAPYVAPLFADDPVFFETFDAIKLALAVQAALQCLALFCEETFVTLQKNRTLFVVSLTSSWIVQVPLVFFVGHHLDEILAHTSSSSKLAEAEQSSSSHAVQALPYVYWTQAAAYLIYLSFYLVYFVFFLDWDREIENIQKSRDETEEMNNRNNTSENSKNSALVGGEAVEGVCGGCACGGTKEK